MQRLSEERCKSGSVKERKREEEREKKEKKTVKSEMFCGGGRVCDT